MSESDTTVEKSDVSIDVSDGEFAVAAYSILSQDSIINEEVIYIDPHETVDITPRDSVRLNDKCDGQVATVLTVAHKTVYFWGRPENENGGYLAPFAVYHTALKQVPEQPDHCVTEYPEEHSSLSKYP